MIVRGLFGRLGRGLLRQAQVAGVPGWQRLGSNLGIQILDDKVEPANLLPEFAVLGLLRLQGFTQESVRLLTVQADGWGQRRRQRGAASERKQTPQEYVEFP